jgi:16S rRNA G966 N2-methylase RsmD
MSYGDNLDILRRYVKDETIDLVYLDPRFKSNQNCGIIAEFLDGHKSDVHGCLAPDAAVYRAPKNRARANSSCR